MRRNSADEISRRKFLQDVPLAAGLLFAHEALAAAPSSRPQSAPVAQSRPNSTAPRLRRLRLLSEAPFPAMRRFYHDLLGFRVLEESATELTFAAGATRLTFAKASPEHRDPGANRGEGKPFYHVAFNIPPDKIAAARLWQLERGKLVPPRANLIDANFTGDVWHFRHWNAHSVFFFDPAFNILEYIARHDLKHAPGDANKFSSADILYASEIGFVFDDAGRDNAARLLASQAGLREYPLNTKPHWAMGDEHGLVLCLARRGQRWAENTDTPVKWGTFPTEAVIAGERPAELSLGRDDYRLVVK